MFAVKRLFSSLSVRFFVIVCVTLALAAALAPAQRRQQRVQAHAAMRQRWMNSQDLADNRAMFNRALGKDE